MSLFEKISAARYINFIFDASDTVASHRIINIAVQLPNGNAFYWKTFDTEEIRHTRDNYITMIWPELEVLCCSNWHRINSICTDTDGVVRACRTTLAATPELQHCFFSLCDSHSLRLLIKDILILDGLKDTCEMANSLVSFFSKSKLQLSRLRTCQKEVYGKGARGFIKA